MASLLDPYCRVTLVEQRGGFLFKVGGPRAVLNDSYAKDCIVPLDRVLKRGKVRTGVVTKISPTTVTFADQKDPLDYDYLVLAVGARSDSACEPPAGCDTIPDMVEHYRKVAAAIGAAKEIVLVGGGPVGVELAGEIRDKYPDKSVVIVCSGPGLCHSQQGIPAPKPFQDELGKICASKKIEVKYNVKANLSAFKPQLEQNHFFASSAPVKVPLSDGTDLPADLIIGCVGATPGGKQLEGIPVDDHGLIKVNKFLQVEGFDKGNVFAIGDCNNSGDIKMSGTAGSKKGMPMGSPPGQADTTFKNILAMDTKGKPVKAPVPIKKATMIVPVGTNGKVGACAGIPSLFSSMVLGLKAKDYFVGIHRKTLGY
eukprot:jgi/Mesvir1/900/Mv17462-RA.1